MLRLCALVGMLAGCESLLGIKDTSVSPDAPPPDAPPVLLVDIGDGRDGPVVVSAIGYTDDVRAALLTPVGAGSTLLHVSTADGFAVGDEVVIIQMTGEGAGRYETGRVASAAAGSLILQAAVRDSYEANATDVSQVIHVPNYTTVMIPSGGRLAAHPWDGATGGVLFFRATGTVQVPAGGVIGIDVGGGSAGAAGEGSDGGPGAPGGSGGARVMCPGLGCSLTNPVFAGGGGPGGMTTAAPGNGGTDYVDCHAGDGGAGGAAGELAMMPVAGGAGGGVGGGAAVGQGGVNSTSSAARPVLGGGGAGSDGGAGGRGGGGGGGGGGPVADTGSSGGTGAKGGDGGDGGDGGRGGAGGGIVMIYALGVEIDGELSARGEAGTPGLDATEGGAGGLAGYAGTGEWCNNRGIYGGQGGGGAGADGGSGGGGGGGGAGGTIIVNAHTVRLAGSVRATGGAASVGGLRALGGIGGDGYEGLAPSGVDGVAGGPGQAGAPGFVYLNFIDTCDGCTTLVDPPAALMDL